MRYWIFILLGVILVSFNFKMSKIFAQKANDRSTLKTEVVEEVEYTPLEKRNAGRNYKIISYLFTLVVGIGTTFIFRKAAKKAKVKMKSLLPVWLLYCGMGYGVTLFISLLMYLLSENLGFLVSLTFFCCCSRNHT